MTKRGNPNWGNGVSGNPNGRPLRPEVAELRESIQRVKKAREEKILTGELEPGSPVDILDHFVERAYTSDQVLIAVVKKLAPDLKQLDVDLNALVDGNLNLQHMSDEEIRAELKKLRSRKNGDKPASGASGKKGNRKGTDPGKGNGNQEKQD